MIIKPVIDLNKPLTTSAYQATDAIREHVILRDRTCVHPYCTKNARWADLDHIIEWNLGGRTDTWNLAPLCRSHHRNKTFSAWTYTMIEPGSYLWRSPLGQVYLRDGTGTRDLTPRPVEPPGG
ncbi:MAG: HNH endonuclease [Nocardioidaceae bacterium]|nr:HNH endonuclease [Nocardioidaceae bacterium]